MSQAVSSAWPLLKQTADEWNEDRAPQLGAALAFYTALSLAPLLVLLLRIAAGLFGDDESARLEIERQTQSLIGREGAEAIQAMIDSADDSKAGCTWGTAPCRRLTASRGPSSCCWSGSTTPHRSCSLERS